MLKFVLIVNAIQLFICWLIFIPSFAIHKLTKKMSRITYMKISLICLLILGITDMTELIVLVFSHWPTKWLNWLAPVIWTILGISYHKEYLEYKETEKTISPSKHL